MPTGSEGSHVLDGLTVRSSIQVGGAASNGARVYVSAPSVTYLMSVDGSVYSARATIPGLRDIHASTASECMQGAINEMGTLGGGIHLLRGTYAWSTPVLLPKNLSYWLRITGEKNAVVTLDNASGKRVFDFNKTADYDTFQKFEIGGFTVDATALATADTTSNRGRNHILLGTYVDGAFQLRMNMKRIHIRDVDVFGAPVEYGGASPAQLRFGLYLMANQSASGEGTQNLVQDIIIERFRLDGGGSAIIMGGHNVAGENAASGMNVLMERVSVKDCFHDPGVGVPTAFGTWDNFQFGAGAQTRDVTLERLHGFNAGDLGLEINNSSGTVVHDCHMHNAWSGGFFVQMFNSPGYSAGGQSLVDGCTYEQSTIASTSVGLGIAGTQSLSQGSMRVSNFGYFSSVADPGVSTGAVRLANSVVKRLVVDGVHAEWTGLATTASQKLFGVAVSSLTTGPTVSIRNVDVSVAGAVSSGTLQVAGVQFNGNGGSAMRVDVDGVGMREAVTGMTAGGTIGVIVGDSTLVSTLRNPVVRRVGWVTTTNDTAPIGVLVNGSGTTTLSKLRIHDCDFSAMPAGGVEVSYAGTSNAANTAVYGVNWRTDPTSAAWPSLAASTVANTNAFGYPVLVSILTNGAGTISAVSVGTPGGSFQTIAGAGSLTVPTTFVLPPGHQFKMTYATTTPTVVYIPVLT